MTDLKAAVFTVLEGWALPLDARKILETAYYAQPKRQWVGLTEDEIQECQRLGLSDDVYKAIEAKLKERNGAL